MDSVLVTRKVPKGGVKVMGREKRKKGKLTKKKMAVVEDIQQAKVNSYELSQ
jgi:hypothetical protein